MRDDVGRCRHEDTGYLYPWDPKRGPIWWHTGGRGSIAESIRSCRLHAK